MDEHDFRFILEPEILKKEGIEKDGRSWIAARIQVRHNVALQYCISPPVILHPSW